MAQRGGMSHIHYKETKGLKVAAGQFVKKGSILTRQGDKWKAGRNVRGKGTVYTLCEGAIYFTKRKGRTFINIEEKKQKTK